MTSEREAFKKAWDSVFLTPITSEGAFERIWRAACEWQREQIADQFADAIQSDLENGVRILNEAAANNFKRGYPALNKLFADINRDNPNDK